MLEHVRTLLTSLRIASRRSLKQGPASHEISHELSHEPVGEHYVLDEREAGEREAGEREEGVVKRVASVVAAALCAQSGSGICRKSGAIELLRCIDTYRDIDR